MKPSQPAEHLHTCRVCLTVTLRVKSRDLLTVPPPASPLPESPSASAGSSHARELPRWPYGRPDRPTPGSPLAVLTQPSDMEHTGLQKRRSRLPR